MASWVKNGSNTVAADAAAASIAVTLTNVAAGELICLWVKYESLNPTVTASDGTTSMTAGTKVTHANGFFRGYFFYILSSVATGSVTYTVTFSGASPDYRRVCVARFSYTGTASFDVEAIGSGTSSTMASGAITTTGTDELVLGAYGEFAGVDTTAEKINGVAADAVIRTTSFTSMWYRILSATFTSGTASASQSPASGADYILNIISFSATSGGGGGSTLRTFMTMGVGK